MTGIQKWVYIIKGRAAISANLTHLIVQPTFQGRMKLKGVVEESSFKSCEKFNPECREWLVCHSPDDESLPYFKTTFYFCLPKSKLVILPNYEVHDVEIKWIHFVSIEFCSRLCGPSK